MRLYGIYPRYLRSAQYPPCLRHQQCHLKSINLSHGQCKLYIFLLSKAIKHGPSTPAQEIISRTNKALLILHAEIHSYSKHLLSLLHKTHQTRSILPFRQRCKRPYQRNPQNRPPHLSPFQVVPPCTISRSSNPQHAFVSYSG